MYVRFKSNCFVKLKKKKKREKKRGVEPALARSVLVKIVVELAE